MTVCGAGQGTSLLLRMNTEDVLRQLGIKGQVEASDVTSAVGARADLILASPLLVKNLSSAKAPVLPIKNYLDKSEIKAALQEFLSRKDSKT